jgi:UDP-2-acetamido-2,6-beta-L-arabino-hexul-4-ose reductase
MTTKVAVTGADGFLGWHLRCHALTRRDIDLVPIKRDPHRAAELLDGVRAVIHLAGVNRGSDAEVLTGNVAAAEMLTAALSGAGTVEHVVYANSVHSGRPDAYGQGKQRAADLLAGSGRTLTDLRLPHLFGEHGRPGYNSFVATFCHELAVGGSPVVHEDRAVELVHAQHAAKLLCDSALSAHSGIVTPAGRQTSVGEVAATLTEQTAGYATGTLPDLHDELRVRLFNQLRSYARPFTLEADASTLFDAPRDLPPRSDERGDLVEIVKGLGVQHQTFFSTTHAGIERGNHFHTRKVERFAVVQGEAEISLRRLVTGQTHRFRVSGARPQVVDIPTLHTHAIRNVGDTELLTLFWTNEVFDPADPDTFPEPVVVAE